MAMQAVAFYEYQDVPGSDEEMPDIGSAASEDGSQNGASSPAATNSTKRRRCTSSAVCDASTGPAAMSDDAISHPQPVATNAVHDAQTQIAVYEASAGQSNAFSGDVPDPMNASSQPHDPQRSASQVPSRETNVISNGVSHVADDQQHDAGRLGATGDQPGSCSNAQLFDSEVLQEAGQGGPDPSANRQELPPSRNGSAGSTALQPSERAQQADGLNMASASDGIPTARCGSHSSLQGQLDSQPFSTESSSSHATPNAGPASAATLAQLKAAVLLASEPCGAPDTMLEDSAAANPYDAGMRHLRLQQWPPAHPIGIFPPVSHTDPPVMPMHLPNGSSHEDAQAAVQSSMGSADRDSQSQPTPSQEMATDLPALQSASDRVANAQQDVSGQFALPAHATGAKEVQAPSANMQSPSAQPEAVIGQIATAGAEGTCHRQNSVVEKGRSSGHELRPLEHI